MIARSANNRFETDALGRAPQPDIPRVAPDIIRIVDTHLDWIFAKEQELSASLQRGESSSLLNGLI